MTKLIIQIPCLYEEKSLLVTLKELPQQLPRIDQVEWLIINDGITDQTVGVAKSIGVDHVVHLIRHQGLARGFMAGIRACVEKGVDIIVNTDADNRYFQVASSN